MIDYSYINEFTAIKELPSIWHAPDAYIKQHVEHVLSYHSHLERNLIVFLFKKSMKYGGTAQVCNKQINAILNAYNVQFILFLVSVGLLDFSLKKRLLTSRLT